MLPYIAYMDPMGLGSHSFRPMNFSFFPSGVEGAEAKWQVLHVAAAAHGRGGPPTGHLKDRIQGLDQKRKDLKRRYSARDSWM
jgi:hypothetical protein